MPGSCAVMGCRSRFVRGGKHFYRFPKDPVFQSLWVQFTRKGNKFVVKKCSAVCEDHFDEARVVIKKKGRLYLMKRTVPTIYYRDTKLGTERVLVDFDPVSLQYVGHESVNLIRGTVTAQEDKALQQVRCQKIKQLKSLCRFCFEEFQDDKFVAMSRLESYGIDPEEILLTLALDTVHSECFSEIVCEQCFQQVVAIDGFRRRCRKAQESTIAELDELDLKLQNIQSSAVEMPWFKFEVPEEDPNQIVIVEEHLDDNISYDCDDDDEQFTVHYDARDFGYKYEEPGEVKELQQIDNKDDSKEPIDEIIMHDVSFDSNFEIDDEMSEEEEEEEEELGEGMGLISVDKDVYDITDIDAIIKNPERNTFALRVYECFFCRFKFAGKKTFKSHNCVVKEVKCEVEGCAKFFNKLSGYNTHVVKVHGLLKTARHFCPICRNVVMATESTFKQHYRQCNKDSERKDSDNPIECEVCKKKCPNLKSYTVHKLFHDSRNLIGLPEKKNASLGTKGPVICELCGKEFTNSQGLRTHKKNVHRVGQPKDQTFQCDICSKMRPTKRSLFNHMRNVHRVRETPCNVCGKVFRTPALLQKHMMYHDETKRIHRCSMCPDKPGWFTNVALKRHQKSHHMGLKEYNCDAEFCEAAFTTNSMLKQHKANYHSYQ